MTIKEAQTTVDNWIKTYGVRYFSELTNMAVLTEEVGELARIMARTYGDQSFKKDELSKNLGDEMAMYLGANMPCKSDRNRPGTSFKENIKKKLCVTVRDISTILN